MRNTVNSVFKRIIGDNPTARDNFITLVKDELIDNHPLFASRKELLAEWPTIDDATEHNELYDEIEYYSDKDDFCYYSFYNIIDLIRGDKQTQVTELVYVILRKYLK